MNTARITVERVGKIYSSPRGEIEAIAEISLSVNPQEIVSVIGPSGCGKTTLLKIVAGLLEPTRGTVQTPPANPQPMIIFQEYERCLLPSLNVQQNVALALLNYSAGNGDKEQRINEALRVSGLIDAKSLYPWQLSSGMQQRVLLARALAVEPSSLLLDEPFSAVDALTRYELEDAIRHLTFRLDTAIVYVTHDVDSAVYCGDHVVVLSPRPARVVAEIPIPLGKSRTQAGIRGGSEFGALRSTIYETLSFHRK